MASLEDRVTALERTFLQVRAYAIAAAIAILIYFGVTSLLHVPQQVREALRERIHEQFEDFDQRIDDELTELETASTDARSTADQLAAQLAAATTATDEFIAEQRHRDDVFRNEQALEFANLLRDNRTGLADLQNQYQASIDELASYQQASRAHLLGTVPCNRILDFPAPVPGTTTDDWIVLTAHVDPSATTTGIGRDEFDNALYGFSTTITPHQDKTGWSVAFDVQVNVATARSGPYVKPATCHTYVRRPPIPEATIVAVPAAR